MAASSSSNLLVNQLAQPVATLSLLHALRWIVLAVLTVHLGTDLASRWRIPDRSPGPVLRGVHLPHRVATGLVGIKVGEVHAG